MSSVLASCTTWVGIQRSVKSPASILRPVVSMTCAICARDDDGTVASGWRAMSESVGAPPMPPRGSPARGVFGGQAGGRAVFAQRFCRGAHARAPPRLVRPLVRLLLRHREHEVGHVGEATLHAEASEHLREPPDRVVLQSEGLLVAGRRVGLDVHL
eukprot:6561979-Prymnesium_polylepis.1